MVAKARTRARGRWTRTMQPSSLASRAREPFLKRLKRLDFKQSFDLFLPEA